MEATDMDWLLIIILVVGAVAGFGYSLRYESDTVIELDDDQVPEVQNDLNNVKQSNS